MIKLQNLNKRYGDLQAVDNLSLEVPSGELFCFLGRNGAGKTTTIKMMTGLVRPDSGTIHLNGIDAIAEPVETKRIMGYIPDMHIKSKAEKKRGKSTKERDGSDVSSADDSDASAEASSRKKKTDDRWKISNR